MKKKKSKKKILAISGAAILCVLALLYAGSYFYDNLRHDPNYMIKRAVREIRPDKARTVKYRSSRTYLGTRTYIPAMYFIPDENTSYTFTISDIVSDDGVSLKMSVMDQNLSDYIYADDAEKKKEDGSDEREISGSSLLNKGRKYYVIIDVITKKKSGFSGSFRLTVTKTQEDSSEESIEELKAGETVKVAVEPALSTTALFRPEESAYYRFESVLTGKRAIAGFSGISSITRENGDEVDSFGGIAYLEQGNDYYVAVEADDTVDKTAHAYVSCTRVETLTANGHGPVELTGETIVEYSAPAKEVAAVWSVSEEDPYAVVYDAQSVPISTDNNSGGIFSRNSSDLALVFEADRYKQYRIFVGGAFTRCTLMISSYTGDGTILSPDTVEAFDPEAPAEEAVSGEDDENKARSDDEIPLDSEQE